MRNLVQLLLVIASALLPWAAGGCAKKKASADAGSSVAAARPKLRGRSPAFLLPPEAPLGSTSRVVFAGAILGGGKVVHRGWLHVGLDGKGLARLPMRWGVPYDAKVDVSPTGARLAWVAVDGRLGISSAAGGQLLASDAEPSVTPAFTYRPSEVLYARRGGPLLGWRSGTSKVIAAGPVRDLALRPDRRSYVFVRGGSELVAGEVAGGQPKSLYRSAGTRVRLLGPRILGDGEVLARERDGSRARLLRLLPGKGPPREVPLPQGVLRAFTPGPGGLILVGTARRRDRRLWGELFLQGRNGKSRRRLGSWARTLPFARLSCDGSTAVLVDNSRRMARLLAVPLSRKRNTRVLTPTSLRVFDARSWALWCPRVKRGPAKK